MTEKRMRWRSIRFQEWDLRFIRASTVASSLEMCCSRFSKSSPCNLKIPFQIREMSPLLFFVTTAASFFAVSLSAAPSSVAIRPDHSSVNRVTVSVVIVCFQNEMRSPGGRNRSGPHDLPETCTVRQMKCEGREEEARNCRHENRLLLLRLPSYLRWCSFEFGGSTSQRRLARKLSRSLVRKGSFFPPSRGS